MYVRMYVLLHCSPLAQVEYTQVNSRWQMPQRNFTVRHQVPDGSGHCLSIVFIDTCPFIPEYDGNSKMPE